MIPGLPTSLQGPFCVGVCAVLTVPLAVALMVSQDGLRQKAIARSTAESQNAETLAQLSIEADQNLRIGLERAKNCQVLDTKTPIGANTGPVRYRGTKTLIPIGTPVCDLNGFTGIQGANQVQDIRPIDSATLQTALQARNPR
jgi:hypothetical protein